MFRIVCSKVAMTVAAAVVLSMPALAGPNLVVDGDFTSPWGGSSYTTYSSSFGPWVVTQGNVDLIGSLWQAPATGQGSVDLDGSQIGGIKQSIATDLGTSYLLSFEMSGNSKGNTVFPGIVNPVKTVEVFWNGSLAGTFTYDTAAMGNTYADMKWVGESLTLNGTGTLADLEFRSGTDPASAYPWYGAAIGDVTLQSIESVPEPAFYQMGAMLALGGLGLLRLRKRA
jgi:hypothetical protein